MSPSQSVRDSYFLYIAGVFAVTYIAVKVLYNLFTHYFVYFTAPAVDYKSFGNWALVTGATDGIGKGFARGLARRGINVVLVSRTEEKLRRVADEIRDEFNVEVEVVAFDFTNSDGVSDKVMTTSVYDVIEEKIRELEIGILVNNVGMAPPGSPDAFLGLIETKQSIINDLVSCNVTSMVKITQLILPQMEQRKKGLIINLSSGIARITAPYTTLYAGSKKFNDTFSRATSYEYESKGIVVQCIQPGLVASNMTQGLAPRRGSITSPTFNIFAENALQTVGKVRWNHGYWLHDIQLSMICLPPEIVTARVYKRFLGNLREKLLKRARPHSQR